MKTTSYGTIENAYSILNGEWWHGVEKGTATHFRPSPVHFLFLPSPSPIGVGAVCRCHEKCMGGNRGIPRTLFHTVSYTAHRAPRPWHSALLPCCPWCLQTTERVEQHFETLRWRKGQRKQRFDDQADAGIRRGQEKRDKILEMGSQIEPAEPERNRSSAFVG